MDIDVNFHKALIAELDEVALAAGRYLGSIKPFDDEVNWGGVNIMSAELRLDNLGDADIYVIIDEAAPGCDLCAKMSAHLTDKLGKDIYVEAEW